MKQVRLGVFETNSSSMHSIVVTKNEGTYDKFDDDFYVDKTGEWEICDENDLCFGRYPFRLLMSFGEKFYYALASYCGHYTCYGETEPPKESMYMFNKLVDIAKKYVPNLKTVRVPERYSHIYVDSNDNVIDVDKLKFKTIDGDTHAYYTVNGVEHEAEYKLITLPEFGFVDHESCTLLKDFLQVEGITLEEFLTNKKYVIVIDGDEYAEFEKWVKSGLINVDAIDYTYCWGVKHYAEDIEE